MTDYVCTACDNSCMFYGLTEERFRRLDRCFCPCGDCETELIDIGSDCDEVKGTKQEVSDSGCKVRNDDGRPEIYDDIGRFPNGPYLEVLSAMDRYIDRMRAERFAIDFELGHMDDAVFALLVNGWSYTRIAKLFQVDREVVESAVERMVTDCRLIDLLVHPDDKGGECDD